MKLEKRPFSEAFYVLFWLLLSSGAILLLHIANMAKVYAGWFNFHTPYLIQNFWHWTLGIIQVDSLSLFWTNGSTVNVWE